MLNLTIALDPTTENWLTREAAGSRCTPAEYVGELLRELADPDHVEGDLIDQLLANATNALPPVMTLDERDEMKAELIDDLCQRVAIAYQKQLGMPMTTQEGAAFRERLEAHAERIWV